MKAKEYLKSIGAEWNIDNYTQMWVPGEKLPKILEEYHQHKLSEITEEKLIELLKDRNVFESDKTSLLAHVGQEPNYPVIEARKELSKAILNLLKEE